MNIERAASRATQWIIASSVLLASAVSIATEARPSPELDRQCGPLRATTTAEGAIDYRLKDTDDVARKSIRNLDHYHADLAERELARGSPNQRARADLNFALTGSPNHLRALKMLVQYDLMGGKVWEFPQTACYFSWARQFAPDDAQAHIVAGYYFWKTGDKERAEGWWRHALEIDPKSADANYNLGLLAFQSRKYDQAERFAKAAYALGYPLPGLRNELKKVGHWSADPARTKDGSQ